MMRLSADSATLPCSLDGSRGEDMAKTRSERRREKERSIRGAQEEKESMGDGKAREEEGKKREIASTVQSVDVATIADDERLKKKE